MKKLVDETTDDFTRTLLVAGIEHRPPAGSKAQLIVALGAGSAIGLFSAKAFGWFGTGAGKVTLFGVALGVAGAVYGIAPLASVEADAPKGRVAVLDERGEIAEQRHEIIAPSAVTAPLLPAPVLPARAEPDESKVAALEPAVLERSEPVTEKARAKSRREATPKSKASKRASRSAALGDQHTGPLSAVETPPAVGALAEVSIPAPHEAENANDRSRLDSEVRLVDEMHWAARRNDREALWRFVETYRLQFPDGQLKEEVAAFAARLDRPAAR